MSPLSTRALRPLDRLRSLKVKLGVLVMMTSSAVAILTWFGLLELGWYPRYTLPVAVLAAMGVTQLLARGMVSPLRELTAAARAMARGDYTRRVQASSRDEVGEAARAFNTMAADLADADRQRRELLANVSHELRTPVAGLQALLENLVDGVTPVDAGTLGAALTQTQRLGRLVTELLDIAAVDGGQVPLRRTALHVAPLLDQAVNEARMGGRAVAFVCRCPADLTAWADEQRLLQVVANLLDNAARHGPPGSAVQLVACATATGGLRLEVSDEGPGIPAADRERVFDRFTRGNGADPDDGGTGLGLAISRWLVELHAGTIRVVDGQVGALIRVELPGAPHRQSLQNPHTSQEPSRG